jgi:hypothetical protein
MDERQARLEHAPGVDAPAGYPFQQQRCCCPFRPEDAPLVGYDPAEGR